MIMAFASNGLRDAFEGQGEAGFVAWTYATYDTLEQVLAPGLVQQLQAVFAGGPD